MVETRAGRRVKMAERFRLAPYHDRMPVLLGEGDFEASLSGELGGDALHPAVESALREWVISKRVNRTGTGDDDPTIAEPAAA